MSPLICRVISKRLKNEIGGRFTETFLTNITTYAVVQTLKEKKSLNYPLLRPYLGHCETTLKINIWQTRADATRAPSKLQIKIPKNYNSKFTREPAGPRSAIGRAPDS